ncbi:DUF3320 domain-containing protein [Kluyvera ascorbata]
MVEPVSEPKHEIERGAPAAETEVLSSLSQPYVKTRLAPVMAAINLHQEKPERLMQMIQTVVDTEAPVHTSEVTRRLMEAFGVTRAGSRITAAVEGAINLGTRRNIFSTKGDFVYSTDSLPIPIRNRAHLESAERKLEWVAPEEIDRALLETITLGFSMSREDAISGALDLLGFGRATAKISQSLEERIGNLISQRHLKMADGVITAANTSH